MPYPGAHSASDSNGRPHDQVLASHWPLPLTARQRLSALADHRVVAVGQTVNELVSVGQLCGANDLVMSRFGLAVRDVLPDRRSEQQRVLQNEADLIADRFLRESANVLTVDRHRAAQRIVEP